MSSKVFFSAKKSFFTLPINPFPFLTSLVMLNSFLSIIGYLHFKFNFMIIYCKLILVLFGVTSWWISLMKNYLGGLYNLVYQNFFRSGFILFMISEIMFFFGFFWSFFHSCWAPTMYIGSCWPPFKFLNMVEDAYSLCKTVILISSACSVTWAHKSLVSESFKNVFVSLVLTCILGFLFLFLQSKEYMSSVLSMKSTVFSTMFFLLTGFHGFHVTMGFIFLVMCLFRFNNFSFSSTYHQGFEFAIWYWHFVDVVWLGLYISVYHYGLLLT